MKATIIMKDGSTVLIEGTATEIADAIREFEYGARTVGIPPEPCPVFPVTPNAPQWIPAPSRPDETPTFYGPHFQTPFLVESTGGWRRDQ